MKRNRNNRARFQRWNEGEGDGGDGANGGAPADSAAGGEGSLLDGVDVGAAGGEGAPVVDGAVADDAWLPDKFRVMKDDGTLDEAASSRKLAESYKALEAHKGPLPQAPASPDDYKLEAPKGADGQPVEGLDMAEFTADPAFKEFAKGAHGKGISNDQLQYVVEQYLQLAPQLVAADQQMSLSEAKAELGKLWPDDAAMSRNISGAAKAMRAFGGEAADMPGSYERLTQKYGRDPDFMAFAARIGEEIKEDRSPASHGVGVPGDGDIESMMKSEAYWKVEHPDHERTKAQVATHFARKHGAAPRR